MLRRQRLPKLRIFSWVSLGLALNLFCVDVAQAVAPRCQALFATTPVREVLQDPSIQQHLSWFNEKQARSFEKRLAKLAHQERLSEVQIKKLSRQIVSLSEAHALSVKNLLTLNIHQARRDQALGEVSAHAFLKDLKSALETQGLLRDSSRAEMFLSRLGEPTNLRSLAIWGGVHAAMNVASVSILGRPMLEPTYLPGLKRKFTFEEIQRLTLDPQTLPRDIRQKIDTNLAYSMAVRFFNAALAIVFIDYLYNEMPEEMNKARLQALNQQMDASTTALLSLMEQMNNELIAQHEARLRDPQSTREARTFSMNEIIRLKQQITEFKEMIP